jgi:hypothetical protein
MKYTELPLRPDHNRAAAVVFYSGDTPFVSAVRGWGADWSARVGCWLSSGQPYAVVVTPKATTAYEKMFFANDDAGFEAAIQAAINSLNGAPCHWRSSYMVRPIIRAHMWQGVQRQRRRQREVQGKAPVATHDQALTGPTRDNLRRTSHS